MVVISALNNANHLMLHNSFEDLFIGSFSLIGFIEGTLVIKRFFTILLLFPSQSKPLKQSQPFF